MKIQIFWHKDKYSCYNNFRDGAKAIVLDSTELFDSATGNFDSVTSTLFDGGQDATVQSSGTYAFASTIDAGSIVTTQITATLTQQVVDRARIFDFVSQEILMINHLTLMVMLILNVHQNYK